jgi:hypothetical protein
LNAIEEAKMDAVTSLIGEFKAEESRKLTKVDPSRKPDIILALEDFADDARVVEFLLSVASDESEYDLARIEVLKLFEVKDFGDPVVRTRIGRAIARVLSTTRDDDVRNYAAMAAGSYLDAEGVFEEVERILHDDGADGDLRWNAFAAMKTGGPSARSISSLQRLLEDQDFKQSASQILSRWQQNPGA